MAGEISNLFNPEQIAYISEHFYPRAAAPPSTVQSPPRSLVNDSDVPLPPESSNDEDDSVVIPDSKMYDCEGWTCRGEDGKPVLYQRNMLVIKGYVLKPGGPEVPGSTWQGKSNRMCVDCYIAKYEADASPDDIDDVRRCWKGKCKQSHRKADRYNTRKKRKAEEDRSETLKQSKQQQGRCGRWSVASRDINEKYPGRRNREFRDLVLSRVKSMLRSILNSVKLMGTHGQSMIAEAEKARVAHLKRLADEGVCGSPDGKKLNDSTLQFLDDLTPDGKNKELFLCRGCGFVHHNHQWHQEKGKNGMLHHFRCCWCHRQYDPWKKDGRFCKFNKVLLNEDPEDKEKFIVTPAWWTETSEQLFVNTMKEYTIKMQIGEARMSEVTYTNISRVIEENVMKKHSQPAIFRKVQVPGPEHLQVATLSSCKGYNHIDTSPRFIEGFFFENHMEIAEDEIFTDFEVLCNEIRSCLTMDDA